MHVVPPVQGHAQAIEAGAKVGRGGGNSYGDLSLLHSRSIQVDLLRFKKVGYAPVGRHLFEITEYLTFWAGYYPNLLTWRKLSVK